MSLCEEKEGGAPPLVWNENLQNSSVGSLLEKKRQTTINFSLSFQNCDFFFSLKEQIKYESEARTSKGAWEKKLASAQKM